MGRWFAPGALACLLAAGGGAQAAIVFDNGSPDLSLGGRTSDFQLPQQEADDFSLGDALSVTDVHWWGYYFGTGVPTSADDFTARFYADAGGVPSMSFLAERDVGDPGRTDTLSTNSLGVHVYHYEAVIAPVALAAGTTYWLSIVNDTPADTSNDWSWQFADSSGTRAARSADGQAWTSYSGEFAFQLTTVPVPGALPLFLSGLVAVGVVLPARRRRGGRARSERAAEGGSAAPPHSRTSDLAEETETCVRC